jgi:hypothetical protein
MKSAIRKPAKQGRKPSVCDYRQPITLGIKLAQVFMVAIYFAPFLHNKKAGEDFSPPASESVSD